MKDKSNGCLFLGSTVSRCWESTSCGWNRKKPSIISITESTIKHSAYRDDAVSIKDAAPGSGGDLYCYFPTWDDVGGTFSQYYKDAVMTITPPPTMKLQEKTNRFSKNFTYLPFFLWNTFKQTRNRPVMTNWLLKHVRNVTNVMSSVVIRLKQEMMF